MFRSCGAAGLPGAEPKSMTLICRRVLRPALRTDFVQAVISVFFNRCVWAASNPSGTEMTTGPTVTGAAWAAITRRNCATSSVAELTISRFTRLLSASRSILVKGGADAHQDCLHALCGAHRVLVAQPPEQRLVHAHKRLQA